ncbi:MAG: GNAT family N-acetyltransferase [Mycobacterium leprae]
MLRPYRPEDLPAIVQMVQAGYAAPDAEIQARIDGGHTLVYDDGQIKGLTVLTVDRSLPHSRGALILFIDPQFRGQGIGRAIWREIWPLLLAAGPASFTTFYRAGDTASALFFSARGFNPLASSQLMTYSGPSFPEPELTVRPYRDTWFSHYVQIKNAAFFSLRRESGLKPYMCYPDGSYDESDLRAWLREQEGKIFLGLAQEKPVGVLELAPPAIEVVAVAPDQQGRGYGRALTQFGINRLKEQGVDPIRLHVLEKNQRAKALYESLGFTPGQTTEYARLTVEP